MHLAKKHMLSVCWQKWILRNFHCKGSLSPFWSNFFIVVVSFISKYFNENYFTIFLLEQNKGFWEIVALGRAFWL